MNEIHKEGLVGKGPSIIQELLRLAFELPESMMSVIELQLFIPWLIKIQ